MRFVRVEITDLEEPGHIIDQSLDGFNDSDYEEERAMYKFLGYVEEIQNERDELRAEIRELRIKLSENL